MRPFLCSIALMTLASPLLAQLKRPPATRAVDHVDTYHGVRVADPYRWLEDDNSAETAAWVQAQNEVTFAYLRGLPQREPLRKRLTELFNYERYSTPQRKAGRYFIFRNDGLQNQSVLYVQDGLAGTPRVLLDPNTLSADGTVAMTVSEPSPDGTRLLYGLSASGSDWQEFKVRDVATGADLADHLKWIKFSGGSWTKDGRGFFYSRYPEPKPGEALTAANRDQKLYYHRLGTPQSEDRLIYQRPDQPDWGFSGQVTEDGRYLVISVWMGTDRRNRVHVLDLRDAQAPDLTGTVVPLLDGFDAGYNFVANDGPVFYFRTDQAAPRGRIIAVDLGRPEQASWREVVAEGPNAMDAVAVVGNQFVVNYLKDAASSLQLFEMNGRPAGEVALPTLGTVGALSGERGDRELFYAFTSFLYPTTIFRYDFDAKVTGSWKAPKVDFDPSRYETRQVFYRSRDGTRVPMFITARKGIALDGSHPTLLYAYGGFNVNLLPSFSATRIAWLEQGGVYAQPNLRGGAEYGEAWHEAGMLSKKQNVFDDFIAAAEYLIAEKYTAPERLAVEGGSNGGLLVGAVMTQRPELFAVALPAVGVMDMLRFHRFTIGWAWVTEYGSADSSAAQFQTLKAYSPLHNLKPGTNYPATLVTTADHDDRVVPAHSFKFAAALQAATTWQRPAYIRIETKAGHGAGKPIAKIIEEEADVMAFALANMALRKPVP
ncbi:MAG TPA: prolyl oligopeptidase family serine peptidase [Gemmatimonadales bacterium]